MANKYVRCESHCKYPAYDKEEVDALLKQKVDVTAYAKLTKEYICDKEGYAVITINFDFPDNTWLPTNTRILEARKTDYSKNSDGTYTAFSSNIIPEGSSMALQDESSGAITVPGTKVIINHQGYNSLFEKADITIEETKTNWVNESKSVYELLLMKVE